MSRPVGERAFGFGGDGAMRPEWAYAGTRSHKTLSTIGRKPITRIVAMRLSFVLLFIWLSLTPEFVSALSLNPVCLEPKLGNSSTALMARRVSVFRTDTKGFQYMEASTSRWKMCSNSRSPWRYSTRSIRASCI